GGTCIDLLNDPQNCGACGSVCPSSEAPLCSNGTCVCDLPFAVCDGVCTDLSSDPGNCGGCGQRCGPGQGCFMGTCCSPTISCCFPGCPPPSDQPLPFL